MAIFAGCANVVISPAAEATGFFLAAWARKANPAAAAMCGVLV